MPLLKTTPTTGFAAYRRSLVANIAHVVDDAVASVAKIQKRKAEPAVDEDLDRLVSLSTGGHNGVNLADLSRKERRRHLTGR